MPELLFRRKQDALEETLTFPGARILTYSPVLACEEILPEDKLETKMLLLEG